MGKFFGTDGIRGIANTFPMTPELMVKLGVILGEKLGGEGNGVVIGRDSRISGTMLESALSAGLAASGTNVWLAQVIPTPAIALLTAQLNFQAGIVISASHNPAQDNGVKIFSHDGFKLRDEFEHELEQRMLDETYHPHRATGGDLGRIQPLPDAVERYTKHLIQSIFSSGPSDLAGLKLVVDCANGAASQLAPAVLRRLHADVRELYVSPDGLNINLNCGALHPEALRVQVQQERADVGIAFDGDADRLILVDEQGQVLDGDHILAILAQDLANKQQLKNQTVVATVMSNLGFELALKDRGIHVVRTAVGDRYVVEKMRSISANLGGEQSGHVVMFDHGTTGDGLASALAVLRILRHAGKPLSELAACFARFPQLLVNVPVTSRKPFDSMPEVGAAIQQAEKELGDRGRILVRYSGTELLARVMVEAEDTGTVRRIAEEIAEEIRKENR